MRTSERINVSTHVSPPPRPPLGAQKTLDAMPRPPLDPLTNVDHPPTVCSDASSSRRHSSISYLPPDSPRLWSPRSPLTGSNSLQRSSSLSGANSPNKDGRSRPRSNSQRAISEPAMLTLAERYTDLLQFIAQKESKCLELRSQLAIHESELLELKRKWERIVRREFGRNYIPSTSTPASPATSAVLNGLVGGVRALAAVTTSPPLTPSASRARPSSSALANREPSQAASNSFSSTTTSSSVPSAADSPRLSQSSMSSVAEVKIDSGKVEGQREEVIARDSGGIKLQSPPSKSSRRRSRDSQATLADALKVLTGEDSHSGSGKGAGASASASASASAASPTSASTPGINPLSAMGLGRGNLGAAQGWVDSVGSKIAELQRGETFSKSQQRASLIFSDVSQSIFSVLAPASTANGVPACAPPARSLLDEEDDAGSTGLGRAMLPDVVAVSEQSIRPQTSPKEEKEEEEESWNW